MKRNVEKNTIRMRDVCSMLGRTRWTVVKYVNDFNLPAYRIGKRGQWFFYEDEIRDWIKHYPFVKLSGFVNLSQIPNWHLMKAQELQIWLIDNKKVRVVNNYIDTMREYAIDDIDEDTMQHFRVVARLIET